MRLKTALQENLQSCNVCKKISKIVDEPDKKKYCPRCGGRLHARKVQPLTRTWAFLVAAIILYIPANIYPMMTVNVLGKTKPDTIISGIISLFESGMWYLGLIVLIASFVVPIVKILVLIFLLISVQFNWTWQARQRSMLYRAVEFVGRWSMLDIFVVSISIAVVSLGKAATIYAGLGARAFALVVILTMFAAMTFDPRLIWDRIETLNKDNIENG